MERWKLYKRGGGEWRERGSKKGKMRGEILEWSFIFGERGGEESTFVRYVHLHVSLCVSFVCVCVCVKEVPMYLFIFIYFFNGKIELV